MTSRNLPTWLAALALLAAAAPSHAQTASASGSALTSASPAQETKPPASGFDQAVAGFKKPAPWLTLGADFRARNEYFNNIVTLAETGMHEQDVFRFRARLSAAFAVAPNLTLNTRLAGEPRYWEKPAFVGAFRARTGLEERFGILDTMNVRLTNLLGGSGTLTLGRQDIALGDPLDWWLMLDGTPNDGSWTTFSDAARLTIEAKSIKTRFDVIGILQEPQPDAWLPTLGASGDYPLSDQKEAGAILYASNKSLPNTQLDAYLMYKRDTQQTFTVAGVSRLSGDNADIFTLGAKITGTPSPHWQYSLEGAYQSGSKEDRISGVFRDRDIHAYGGKGKLTYSLKDEANNQFHLAGEILSGDDPGSAGTDEMFDVLWGRWPRWSELYIYSYIYETGGRVAQLNNLGRLGGGWSATPAKGTTLSLMYNALFALEETPSRAVAPALFSNDGHFRGHYAQVVLKRQFNKYLSGHLWAEWVRQGNFYTARENLTFLRAEVMVAF